MRFFQKAAEKTYASNVHIQWKFYSQKTHTFSWWARLLELYKGCVTASNSQPHGSRTLQRDVIRWGFLRGAQHCLVSGLSRMGDELLGPTFVSVGKWQFLRSARRGPFVSCCIFYHILKQNQILGENRLLSDTNRKRFLLTFEFDCRKTNLHMFRRVPPPREGRPALSIIIRRPSKW